MKLDFWKDKKIFLTGNTGFKGSWLTLWLELLGSEIVGYSLDSPTSPSLFDLADIGATSQWIKGDIRDLENLKRAVDTAQPDIVFHLAAQALVRESYRHPLTTYETNVMGTLNLLECIRYSDTVKAVVIITSDKCYDNKEWPWGYRENDSMGGYDPYSSSKGCAELLTSSYRSSFFNPAAYGKDHHVALASARAGNVIGGGDFAKDRLIPDIVYAIKNDKKVTIRSPHAIRPWQHVLEPLSGYLCLAESLYNEGCKNAEGWNFGPNDEDAKTVSWIVENMCSLWPDSKGFVIADSPSLKEAYTLKLDTGKARSRLLWKPIWNLSKTLKSIVEWNLADGSRARAVTSEQILEYQSML